MAATALTGVGGAAFAQTAVSAAAAVDASQPAGAVGEIVVTARHRTETVQSVPATVSVVAGDFLSKTVTTNIYQLVTYLPSVQFTYSNPRNSSINIRGLGNASGVASDGMDPGVGFYVDQVYYNRPATTTFDLMDIDRVEVLEGPQGTLYGKNSTAGAIAITTASPTFTPEGKLELSGGNYGYYVAKGSLSGPLVGDVLAGRLSVSTSRRDGLGVNDYNGADIGGYRNVSVRGQLLYAPTSDLKVRVIGDYSHQDQSCCANVLSGIVKPANGKDFTALEEHFGYTPVVDPFSRHYDYDAAVYARQETGGLSVQADYSLPKVVLSSITAWRFWNWWPGNDVDSSPLPVFTKGTGIDYENQFTQEFRVASAGENRVDYVGGLYLFREQVQQHSIVSYGADAAYFVSTALPSLLLDGFGTDTLASYNTWSGAAYGQGVLHITRQWSLTGGLRYTYDRKDGGFVETASGGVPLTGPLAALASVRAAFGTSGSSRAILNQGRASGLVTLSYKPSEDLTVYGTVSEGNRSGGINLALLPANVPAVIQPETIDNFELGAKARFFDRRLTVDASLFYEQDKNYQGTVIPPGSAQGYLLNIPKVRSEGVELAVSGEPNRFLTFYANGAYDAATYASFPDSPCGIETTASTCDLSGRPLAGVPLWSASFGGELHAPVKLGARAAEAYFGVDDSYRSTIFSSATDSVYTRLPQLDLLNLRAGVRSPDGRWDLFAWGKNVTDVHYFTATNPGGLANPGGLYSMLGDPATYGITLRIRN